MAELGFQPRSAWLQIQALSTISYQLILPERAVWAEVSENRKEVFQARELHG